MTTIPPYNLLEKPPKKMKAPALDTMLPDLLTSLKQRATSATVEDELARHDSELQTKFARIFEPPPHVD